MPEAKLASLPAADPGSTGFATIQLMEAFRNFWKPILRATVCMLCAGSIAVDACAQLPIQRPARDPLIDAQGKAAAIFLDLTANYLSYTQDQITLKLKEYKDLVEEAKALAITAQAEQGFCPTGADAHDMIRDIIFAIRSVSYQEIKATLSLLTVMDWRGGLLEAGRASAYLAFNFARIYMQHGIYVVLYRNLRLRNQVAKYFAFGVALSSYTIVQPQMDRFSSWVDGKIKGWGNNTQIGGRKLLNIDVSKGSAFGNIWCALSYAAGTAKVARNDYGEIVLELAAIKDIPRTRIVMPKNIEKLLNDDPYWDGQVNAKVYRWKKAPNGNFYWIAEPDFVFTMNIMNQSPAKIISDGERDWMLTNPTTGGYKIYTKDQEEPWQNGVDRGMLEWNKVRGAAIDIAPGPAFVWAVNRYGDPYYCKQPCYGDWKKYIGTGYRLAIAPAKLASEGGKTVNMVFIMDGAGLIWTRPEDMDAYPNFGWQALYPVPPRALDFLYERDPVFDFDWNLIRTFPEADSSIYDPIFKKYLSPPTPPYVK